MKEKRSNEEQVYDVHGFIGRYIAVLNAQHIPFKKEQIGILEQLLLAENPAPVKPREESPRDKLLNRIVSVKSIKYYLTTIHAVERVDESLNKKYGTYTNRDLLKLYEYCMRDYPNVNYTGRGFGPLKLRLLGEYLRQKGLLPADQAEPSSAKSETPKDL